MHVEQQGTLLVSAAFWMAFFHNLLVYGSVNCTVNSNTHHCSCCEEPVTSLLKWQNDFRLGIVCLAFHREIQTCSLHLHIQYKGPNEARVSNTDTEFSY